MMNTNRSTLELITAAAREEFLDCGYQTASLRSIAKKAGVTTGALYGYFDSKAALFDTLVSRQYHELMDLYQRIIDGFSVTPADNRRARKHAYVETALRSITDYIYSEWVAFRLILCCSQGTPYCDLVKEMAMMDVKATRKYLESLWAQGEQIPEVNPILEHMLSSGMFATFFELVVRNIPRQEADTYIAHLRTFYCAGWEKLMGL